MEVPYHPLMDDVRPLPTPPGWIEALDRAEADVAAGRTVDAATIHAKLRVGIERMEARKAAKQKLSRPL
jgi:hypothetical protein